MKWVYPVLLIAAMSMEVRSQLLVSDDFSTYGTRLTTGETTDAAVYSWNVSYHVELPLGIPINSSGLQLAGDFPTHIHPRNWTAEADLVFTSGGRPQAEGTQFEFHVFERHDKIEFELLAEGRATIPRFIFSGSGQAAIVLTDTGINEYLNGSLIASRTYASLGWLPTDKITEAHFTGLLHDNGNNTYSYIDNLHVYAVPELDVFALLIPASLMALRRRR